MKAVLQRVRWASVAVEGQQVGAIGQGLLVLVCAEPQDTPEVADKLLAKMLKLRIFSDEQGKMNRSLQDVDGQGQAGGLLLVSQFTLAADCSGGNRPSFTGAAPAAQGEALFNHLLQQARAVHAPVASGVFGADMQVELLNDGPVTICLQI
ncbi:MAG: D-aminoacyl-tRNA deacylase [Brachymonas sp.]|nr:D-aminoacyl-tRNA deacylase [Brachymonas sp.]